MLHALAFIAYSARTFDIHAHGRLEVGVPVMMRIVSDNHLDGM